MKPVSQKSKIYLFILLASLTAPVLVITSNFFPYTGLGLTLLAYTSIAYIIKKDKNIFSKSFFVVTFLLTICLFIRSEGFLTFLNITGIIYFASLSLSERLNSDRDIISVVISPLNLILRSLSIRSEFKPDAKSLRFLHKKNDEKKNTFIVTVFTCTSLAVILPLLASANPIFKKLLSDIINLFGLKNLHFTDNVFLWIFRFIVSAVLIFIIPKIATYSNKKQVSLFNIRGYMNMLIPKTTVSFVLIIFFITQIQLYFVTPQTLSDLGYTYSRYANEVFAQLSTVGAIILAILYFEKEDKKINNIFTHLLSFEGIFLNLMAYKSAIDYISSWGFTYKRLYGIVLASLIMGMFIIFLYGSYKKLNKTLIFKSSLIYTGLILLLINFINFDYIIYNCGKASTGQGIDYAYLARLSPDSLSYQEQFKRLSEINLKYPENIIILNNNSEGAYTLLNKIENLQKKYRNNDFRSFSLLEYLQYKKIEEIDIKYARETLLSKL